MYRKATLILTMALAFTLMAATVATGAPKEKRVVCQDGVTKEIPAHAKAKGATEGPCEETPPPDAGDLAGLTAVPQDEEPNNLAITALFIYEFPAGCVVDEAVAQLKLERDGVQYILSPENNGYTTWYVGSTVISWARHDGSMQFELPDGTLTWLPRADGAFTIVSSSGVTCSQ